MLRIYASIGQKASSILEILLALLKRDAVKYLIPIVASGSARQFISPYTGKYGYSIILAVQQFLVKAHTQVPEVPVASKPTILGLPTLPPLKDPLNLCIRVLSRRSRCRQT